MPGPGSKSTSFSNAGEVNVPDGSVAMLSASGSDRWCSRAIAGPRPWPRSSAGGIELEHGRHVESAGRPGQIGDAGAGIEIRGAAEASRDEDVSGRIGSDGLAAHVGLRAADIAGPYRKPIELNEATHMSIARSPPVLKSDWPDPGLKLAFWPPKVPVSRMWP